MREDSLKRGKRQNRFSQLARFWRRRGKQYCAIALCASLIAGHVGNMASAADDGTSNDYEFELDRVALYEALQEAVENDQVINTDFEFEGEAADVYASLMEADGSLYELKPEIEGNDGAVNLRIFARLDGDIGLEDEATESQLYDVDGSEEVIFLLTNASKEEKTATVIVDDMNTEKITVAPASAVLTDDEIEASASMEGKVVTSSSLTGTFSISGGGSGGSGGSGSSPSDKNAGRNTEEAEQLPSESSDSGSEISEPEIVIDPVEDSDETDAEISNEPEVVIDNDDDIVIDVSDPKDEAVDADENDNLSSEENQQKDEESENSGSDHSESGEDQNSGDTQNEGGSEVSVEEDNASDHQSDEGAGDISGDGENNGDTVAAGLSYHNTFRVAATPSNSDATPSDATDSNADKAILDGTLYGMVLMDGKSAVAFATTMDELGVSSDGHLSICVDGCTGEDCECACHAKAHEILDKVEELLEKTRTFTEETDWETMYAVYEALFALPDEMDEELDNGELTDAEYEYVQEKLNVGAEEILALLAGLGFDPYAAQALSLDDKFYWRFSAGKNVTNYTAERSGSTELTQLAEKIHITYESVDGTIKDLPYSAISLDAGTIMGDSVKKSDVSDTIYITTDEDYVITSYMIGCEFPSSGGKGNKQYGEDCKTAATNNLQVVLNVEGLYKSDLTITAKDYVGESGTSGFFGHRSENSSSNVHYVLLVTVARVNVNLIVDKESDRESVTPGIDDAVQYTVTASTTNTLTNPTFNDEFLKRSEILSVKEKDANGNTGNLDYSYSDGVISINNYTWVSSKKIVIEYKYDTPDDFNETILKNQVIATGKKTESSSVEDIGIAQVDVIVNDPELGSLRIYKTFDGLTSEQVYDSENGILKDFYITVTGDDKTWNLTANPKEENGNDIALKYGSSDSDKNRFTVYGDIHNVNPEKTYTITEHVVDIDGYVTTSSYIVTTTMHNEDGTTTSTTDPVSGTVVSPVTVTKGETTYIRFTNTYCNNTSIIITKIVTGNRGSHKEEFTFSVHLEDGKGNWLPFPAAVGDGYTVTDNKATVKLTHGNSVRIDDIPIGAEVVVTEAGSEGYTPSYIITQNSKMVKEEKGNKSSELSAQATAVAEPTDFVFTNENQVEIDSGVILDSLPYVLILAAAIGGAAFYFIRKKKDDESDLE